MTTDSNLFLRYPVLETCRKSYDRSLELLIESFSRGGKVLVMGNGGSSADAEHFCGELVKGFALPRKLTETEEQKYADIDPVLASHLQRGLPAISLGVSHALISAFANDVSWEYVFAQQVHVLAQENDVVFAISTSGNSRNIVAALKVARAKGLKCISLTGESPSLCSEFSQVNIRVPKKLTHEIQELHLPIYHSLAFDLEQHFYGQ